MANPPSKSDIGQPNLENALRDALKSVLEKDGRSDPRTSFYHKFKEEVAEHDEDFHQKYNEDLNTTLVFSGLFSAIVSAFIINIQSQLTPDYEQLNNAVLELLLNVTAEISPPGQAISPPRWTGPGPGIRQVQAILYATLCATLFASFLATLGKQWLNRYRRTDTHGSVVDRCRDRERKLNGIENWRFDIVMQSAPLTIQGSIGLLGSALARYLWDVDHMISSVVIGFILLGFTFYAAMVTVSVYSIDCPFQTPLSWFIRFIFGKLKTWWKKNQRQVAANLTDLAGGGLTAGAAPLYALHRRVFHSSLSWEKGYKFDARCITRMLVMSTDVDTIRFTMDFVQEVVWDAGIKNVPLGWIYRKLMSCFDFTHPQTPILIPTLRDVAYLSAKALTHIQVQQRVPQRGGPGPVGDIWHPDAPHIRLGYPGSRIDPDLGSALLMVDMALGLKVVIPWDNYRLSPAHHLWVSHLFIHFALREPLSDDVSDFVKYSLDPDRSPGDAVITDCLYIINIILGTRFRVEDLTRRDKSRHMNTMIDRIFLDLSRHFQNQAPQTTADALERSFRALTLITRLRANTVATRSYELFGTVMGSTVAQERKMEAAQLTLHAAYQPGFESVTPIQDPRLIFDFLRSHIDPSVERNEQAISSAMRAIDSTSENPASRSWTWHIENADELLTWFQQSSHPEAFNWWYRILWLHYGVLDPGVCGRMDDIAKSVDDRVDLKQCRIAVEKEIERVTELDGATSIVRSLKEAYNRLTVLIDYREKSRLQVVPFAWPAGALHIVRDYRRL